ncbi:MAG: 6-phosphogluconolactonase [Steroidobacteraceae bacterium]
MNVASWPPMESNTRDKPASVRERRFDSPAALVATIAADVARSLQSAIDERGQASLVVSGGTTPVPLFRALREIALPWEHVSVTLADERWVALDDASSNEGLVRRELVTGAASAAKLIGLRTPPPTAQQGAAQSWQRLEAIARPFDVVVLGMGDDGHTASLFPGSPGIAAALDPSAAPACVAMSAPAAPNARLSLNLAALLQARRVLLHITGARKWQVYRDAAAAAASGLSSPPIAAVLRSGSGVQVCWSP